MSAPQPIAPPEMSDLTAPLERAIAAASPVDLPALDGELSRLKAQVLLRIVGAATPAEPEDRWLDTRDAAAKLGMSASWLYEHGAEFTFRRKVGGRYRFSERGINEFQKLKRGRG